MTTLTPEQKKEVGAALRAAFDAIAHDLFQEGPSSMSRKDAIETAADYVSMYGMRVVKDPVVREYLKDEMFDDRNLVAHCIASGYWNHTRYGI